MQKTAVVIGTLVLILVGIALGVIWRQKQETSSIFSPSAKIKLPLYLPKTGIKIEAPPYLGRESHQYSPDKKTSDTNSSRSISKSNTSFSPTVPSPKICYQIKGLSSRSASDRPDDSADYQLHIIYALPSDGVDHGYDTNGTISKSVSAWENWLCNQTGGKTLRLDTYQGALDISFVRFSATDNTIKTGSELPWSTNPNSNPYVRDDIAIRLKSLGFTDPRKLYAIYYDGTSNYSCGGGAWPPTISDHYAALYMHGGDPAYPSCDSNKLASDISSPGYFEFDILHEVMHTLGFVATCAPHHNWGGHVGDNARDLMQAGQDWGIAQGLLLDPGNDDYYNTSNTNCLDLRNSAFLVGGGSQAPPNW